MRGSSFSGSLVFALIAALGSIPWMMVAMPLFGRSWALGVLGLGTVAIYLGWIAPDWPKSLSAAFAASVLALLVVFAGPMPAGGVFGGALILAVARGVLLFRGKPLRTLVLEIVLVGLGLLFARLLMGSTLLSLALAVWSFYLVQSVFFLIGGFVPRRNEEPRSDPFEAARRQAVALMEKP